MKPFVVAAAALLPLAIAQAGKRIETRALNPENAMRITLSPNVMTTLKFPEAVSCISGLGLAEDTGSTQNAVAQADVGIRRQSGAPFLGMHALSPTAHEIMTVVLGDGQMYVFELETGANPDVAITLVKGEPNGLPASGPVVTPADVVADRPRQNVDLYLGLIDRAKQAGVLRPVRPDLFRGYSSQEAAYTSEGDLWKTTVTRVHGFPEDDAIVLEGTVLNKTPHSMTFDASAVNVLVGNELHAAKLVRVKQPIAVGEEAPIEVLLQGEPNGFAAANLSVDNPFLIYLPQAFGEVAGVWNPAKSTASTAQPSR